MIESQGNGLGETYRQFLRELVQAPLEPGPLLRRALEFVAGRVGADGAVLWVPEGPRFTALSATGSPDADLGRALGPPGVARPPEGGAPAPPERPGQAMVPEPNRLCVPIPCAGQGEAILELVRRPPRPPFGESERAVLEALSDLIGLVARQSRLQERLQASVASLRVLGEVSRQITSSRSLPVVLEQILQSITQVMRAQAGSVLLLDPATGELVFEVATGSEAQAVKAMRVPVEGSIAGLAVHSGRPVVIDDATADPRHFKKVDEQAGHVTRSLVAVPLVVNDQVLGVVEAINRLGSADGTQPGVFSPDEVELFQAFADQAAIAIQNARLNEALEQRARELHEALQQLEASYDATLRALTSALDLRDRETAGHSERVTAYTLELARAVGIRDPAELSRIRRGAWLHDIGKIGVPDAILHKPGPLDEEERRRMQLHPELGFRILERIPFLRDATDIVLYHHERWDGTGYPRGLRGPEIPLPARLFAVADTLDAITSDRPYRQAQSFERARAVIQEGSGSQFDPAVVQAFLAIPLERWQEIRAQTSNPGGQKAELWSSAGT